MSARPPQPDPVRAITDAVLYEGYLLWPYRRSALKNAHRWTFGGVHPRTAGEEPWWMQTQCLVEGGAEARVDLAVRFLHVVCRQVLDADGRPVDGLDADAGGERILSWDEAVEREVALPPTPLGELADGERLPIAVPAGRSHEPLDGGAGAGALLRSWERLEGAVAVHALALEPALHVLTVRIENTTPWAGGAREELMRRTLCSTHTAIDVEGGAFASMTDPPPWLGAPAGACENAGTWPVLVGEEGAHDRLLSSPIVLSDYPRVAPESPGDLFDGGEIDQLLILNLLALTDEEKAEVRATDPRARELLERSEALTPEQRMALHGTWRS